MPIASAAQYASALNLVSTDALMAIATKMGERSIARHLGYNPVQSAETEIYPMTDRRGDAGRARWESTNTTAVLRSMTGRDTSLFLKRLPVRGATSASNPVVYEDLNARHGAASSPFPASTLLTYGTAFWVDWDDGTSGAGSTGDISWSGKLIREVGWPSEAGTVKVTYTAGFSDAEFAGTSSVLDASDIRAAAYLMAGKAYATLKHNQKNHQLGMLPGALVSERKGDYQYTVNAATAADRVGGAMNITPEVAELLESYVHYGRYQA